MEKVFSMIDYQQSLPGNVILEMVGIPEGSFYMGSTKDRMEKPKHIVNIAKPFYLGKYPITQAQYEAVMTKNPSYFKGDPQLPVEQVSWCNAVEFCHELSKKTERHYRLPSEAEWEYACRSGTTTLYYFGNDASQLEKYAWYVSNSEHKTHIVGQKEPNGWGLYDMTGNVYEWCQDRFHANYRGAPDDGKVWIDDNNPREAGNMKRGGAWYSNQVMCRSAHRSASRADVGDCANGFRVVCEN